MGSFQRSPLILISFCVLLIGGAFASFNYTEGDSCPAGDYGDAGNKNVSEFIGRAISFAFRFISEYDARSPPVSTGLSTNRNVSEFLVRMRDVAAMLVAGHRLAGGSEEPCPPVSTGLSTDRNVSEFLSKMVRVAFRFLESSDSRRPPLSSGLSTNQNVSEFISKVVAAAVRRGGSVRRREEGNGRLSDTITGALWRMLYMVPLTMALTAMVIVQLIIHWENCPAEHVVFLMRAVMWIKLLTRGTIIYFTDGIRAYQEYREWLTEVLDEDTDYVTAVPIVYDFRPDTPEPPEQEMDAIEETESESETEPESEDEETDEGVYDVHTDMVRNPLFGYNVDLTEPCYDVVEQCPSGMRNAAVPRLLFKHSLPRIPATGENGIGFENYERAQYNVALCCAELGDLMLEWADASGMECEELYESWVVVHGLMALVQQWPLTEALSPDVDDVRDTVCRTGTERVLVNNIVSWLHTPPGNVEVARKFVRELPYEAHMLGMAAMCMLRTNDHRVTAAFGDMKLVRGALMDVACRVPPNYKFSAARDEMEGIYRHVDQEGRILYYRPLMSLVLELHRTVYGMGAPVADLVSPDDVVPDVESMIVVSGNMYSCGLCDYMHVRPDRSEESLYRVAVQHMVKSHYRMYCYLLSAIPDDWSGTHCSREISEMVERYATQLRSDLANVRYHVLI